MKSNKVVVSTVITILKVVIFVVIVMCVYKLASVAYNYGYRVFTEAPVDVAPGKDVQIAIGNDDSAKDIGKKLEEAGLVEDRTIFYLQNITSKYKGDLLPGVYVLNTSMTAEQMMEIIAAGESAQTTTDENTSDTSAEDADVADGGEGGGTAEDGVAQDTSTEEDTDDAANTGGNAEE